MAGKGLSGHASYFTVKPFYIRIPEGSSLRLQEAVARYLRWDAERARERVLAGGVWSGKKRLLDPSAPVAGSLLTVYPDGKKRSLYTPLDPEWILYRDDSLLVVYKPPNWAVHPTPIEKGSLLTALREAFPEESLFPGNRIDLEAHGLVFFPRSRKGAELFNLLIRERKIEKFYLALTPHMGNPPGSLRFTNPLEGKEAETRGRYLGETAQGSLFEVKIGTGRFHQIRKHFALNLSPLLGEKKYGGGAPSGGELALLCYRYRWSYPGSEEVQDVSFIPPRLKEWKALLTRGEVGSE